MSMIGRNISHFEVLERLGAGGMGVVYKARDMRLDRIVALKFLSPDTRTDRSAESRFIQEAKAASALDHANICTVYEIDETDGGDLFIAMAYYEGRSLKQFLDETRSSPVPIEDVRTMVVQIALGLQRAHLNGIVHRDIKPGNLILTDWGEVKILDFGLAKMTNVNLTSAGATLGTLQYMSPEQASGGEVDHRTDIWSLGVVLYELLTHKRPFEGEYAAAVVYAIVNAAQQSVAEVRPDVPDDLARIVDKALKKDPEERYQSMGELLSELTTSRRGFRPAGLPEDGEPSYVSNTRLDQLSGESLSFTSSQARQQVTAIFCSFGDGSTSVEADPEAFLEALALYQDACQKVIARYEGQWIPHPGNGLLAYFGYPRTHEDDAVRAVKTGVGILESFGAINERRAAEDEGTVNVKIGVHTGMVVAEDLSIGDSTTVKIVGKTPEVAAALPGFGPEKLLITEPTYELIKGFFTCRDLGVQAVRGLERPVPVFEVLHESTARTRLDASDRVRTPLVGREHEVGILLDRWRDVQDGMGQIVLISGEAGIGKSRLAQALKEHIADSAPAWLTECQCSPYHRNSAFHPIVDFLERVVLGFEPEDGPDEKLDRLEGFLVQYGLPLNEQMPLWAKLLSVPFASRYAAPTIGADQEKQKTMQALLSVLLHRASQQPLLLLIEDLHWADPSTIELLNIIVDQAPTTPMLVLLTYRPDYVASWGPKSYLTHISLSRFTTEQVRGMVAHITDNVELPQEVINHIIGKTDGVPIFVEELTKMVLESDWLERKNGSYELVQDLPQFAIPATLQDSLAARLDRLSSAKQIAQLGAVIGREFSHELIQAVAAEPPAKLDKQLRLLVDSELLFQRGLPPSSNYLFKHALIRDAAYDSLLRSKRKEYHSAIAEALVEVFPARAEQSPEIVAYHYGAADEAEKAVPLWLSAGQRSVEKSALIEGIAHFRQGLEMLANVPDSPERDDTELAFQSQLGPALMATQGYASSDVESTYLRVEELCRRRGEKHDAFAAIAIWGLWALGLVRSRFEQSREMAAQMLNLALAIGAPDVQMEAQMALGITLYWMGRWSESVTHANQSLASYDFESHHAHALLYGQDPGVACHAHIGLGLWAQGYPDRALEHALKSLELATRGTHRYSHSYALVFAAYLHTRRREVARTSELTKEAIAHSSEHRHYVWLADALIFDGWAAAQQGQLAEGIAQMERGIAGYEATGALLWRSEHLALLAEAKARAGNVGDALAALDLAFQHVANTDETYFMPELHRIRAGILRRGENADPEKIKSELRTAIGMAIDQESRMFELRSRVDLCSCLDAGSERDTAIEELRRTYEWFREGFDTPDLLDARTLLEST